MATPFDLRFVSSEHGLASPPGMRVPAEHPAQSAANPAFARLPGERHPVGLLAVVGLHVLLAAALMTARLDAGPAPPVQVALTRIADAPPPKPRELPNAPRMPLHPAVVPVPNVVVDRPDSIQAATLAATSAPTAAAAPAPVKGDDAGSLLVTVPAQPVRLDAGAAACRPVYPHVAEREGVTGVTKLRFVVDASGHVSAELLQSSGPLRQNRRMDEAAIEALSHCPVTVGTDARGRPASGTVDVNYKWTIN